MVYINNCKCNEAELVFFPFRVQVLPGGIEQYNTSLVQMSNLFSLPENDYFECTADNDVPPVAVVRITVEKLRYPNGSTS